MVFPVISWSDAAILVVTLLVLAVPGAVVALAAGLRGWRLATAPLLSYAVIGLAGPWSQALGLRWNVLVLLVATFVFAGLLALIRRSTGRPLPLPAAPWLRPAHLAVAACVVVASVIGAVATLVGLGNLDGLLGGWDAGFHANGIRWIVETGDGGVNAMTKVNWYGPVPDRFYPNAYHLTCAVVDQIVPGDNVPAAMNATTTLTPAVFALGMAALVFRFGGRSVVAGVAALLVVAAGPVVDLFYYGPLLPFAMGLALIPAAVVLAADVLEAPSLREGAGSALLLALAAAALLSLHPGVLATALVFALPAMVALWWSGTVRPATAAPLLLVSAVLTMAGCTTQLTGALGTATGPAFDWPAVLSPAEAIGQVILFQHGAENPQLWLALGLVLGVLTLHRMEALRWVAFSGLVFLGLYVAAASFDTPWSLSLTSPWWNDRYRLVAAAMLGLVLVAAHGLGELQRRTSSLVRTHLRSEARWSAGVAGGTAAVLVLGLAVVTHGFYLGTSEARVRNSVGAGAIVAQPTVTPAEQEGYAYLASVVGPGQRVMNDRLDGSLWMYALDGVRPVFGHYDSTDVSPDQVLLEDRFDDYDVDPEVRAAAARLDVSWAVVGRGFVTGQEDRAPGMLDLDAVRSLRVAYRNADVAVYEVLPAPVAPAPIAPGPGGP